MQQRKGGEELGCGGDGMGTGSAPPHWQRLGEEWESDSTPENL